MCPLHEVPFNSSGQIEPAGPVASEKLTVGIEFEFFIAHELEGGILQQDDVFPERWMLLQANQGYNPSEVVKRYIVRFLEDTVPIYSTHPLGRSMKYLKDKIAKFGIASLTDFPEYAMWQATTDLSLHPVRGEDPPGYDFTHNRMELISRVLAEDSLDEIELVYRRLRESMRVHVNSTCGLHVHVSVGHLSFLEIKKLVTVLCSFEPFLFHLVAPSRKYNAYCLPLTTTSRAYTDNTVGYEYQGDETIEKRGRDDENEEMDAWVPPSRGLSDVTRSAFRHIWNSTTVAHIRNELHHSQAPAFGSSQKPCAMLRGESSGIDIDGNSRPADMTLEFRHREATGDPVVDTRWLDLCVALVRSAQSSKDEFAELIRTAGNANVQLDSQPRPEAFAILLGALGLGAYVDFWQGTFQRYQDKLANPIEPAILPPLPKVP
ncbi:hypothetical protein N0V93_002009 [Gnomoniopsis smithogilvyi]|uniref:Amidoligase enzyme n=1 Tax=Gnomoniopsis smithogilvyi TaxID=1191159 RepID=A0A9W9D1R9_9PEZI|nr:hypothetical protein N0V93_002009 [Gnomoniopsis smithogilvyi]